MIIIAALVVIGIYIYLTRKKAKDAPTAAKKQRIDANYICDDGSFHIKGTKNSFQISKNDRFSFCVEDGQIVSFIDRSESEERITYGGSKNGDC